MFIGRCVPTAKHNVSADQTHPPTWSDRPEKKHRRKITHVANCPVRAFARTKAGDVPGVAARFAAGEFTTLKVLVRSRDAAIHSARATARPERSWIIERALRYAVRTRKRALARDAQIIDERRALHGAGTRAVRSWAGACTATAADGRAARGAADELRLNLRRHRCVAARHEVACAACLLTIGTAHAHFEMIDQAHARATGRGRDVQRERLHAEPRERRIGLAAGDTRASVGCLRQHGGYLCDQRAAGTTQRDDFASGRTSVAQ